MSVPRIRNQLRLQRGWLLFGGLWLLFGVAMQFTIVVGAGVDGAREDWRSAGRFAALEALCVLPLVVLGALRLWRWRRHPAMLALARYGPPEQVVAGIDAELEMPGRVLSFDAGPWASGATYVTPSWLVYLDGGGLTCLRLDSIVRAARVPAGLFARLCPVRLRAKAVFEDRHGVRITVAAREARLNRLLTEVVARVPWALKRFDEEPGPPASEGAEQVVAAGRPGEHVRREPGVQAPQEPAGGGAGP